MCVYLVGFTEGERERGENGSFLFLWARVGEREERERGVATRLGA